MFLRVKKAAERAHVIIERESLLAIKTTNAIREKWLPRATAVRARLGLIRDLPAAFNARY